MKGLVWLKVKRIHWYCVSLFCIPIDRDGRYSVASAAGACRPPPFSIDFRLHTSFLLMCNKRPLLVEHFRLQYGQRTTMVIVLSNDNFFEFASELHLGMRGMLLHKSVIHFADNSRRFQRSVVVFPNQCVIARSQAEFGHRHGLRHRISRGYLSFPNHCPLR